MKRIYVLIVMVCVWGMAGCMTMDIANDYDTEYKFGQLKTYDWLPGIKIQSGDGRINDRTIEMRIKKAVENELGQKGFTRVDGSDADFLVGFNAAVNKPLYRDTFYERGVVDYGRFEVYYEAKSAYEHPDYDRGSVVIDVITPDTKTIVWRGSAQAGIQIDYVSTEEKKKRLAKAVHKILKKFPPEK